MSDSTIFERVERELGVVFDEKSRPKIIHLRTCDWSFYPFPVLTLLLQSAASVVGAIESMSKCIPDVVVPLLYSIRITLSFLCSLLF